LQAELLEKTTGVKVLRHPTKKPGCYNEILEFFKTSPDTGVTRPDQIVIVGDRLCTDVLMANMMGSWAVWVKDGPRPAREKLYGRIEAGIFEMLQKRGWKPMVPSSRTL
jgi:phosphatidylglycerophosphatase GEP4